MRNSYPSGLTGKEDPDLLIQLPGKTVFRIFHLKAQSGQIIADFITGSPILIGFGYHTLFQKHIHHFAESFFTSAGRAMIGSIGFALCRISAPQLVIPKMRRYGGKLGRSFVMPKYALKTIRRIRA